MTVQHNCSLTAELIDEAILDLTTIHDWLRFAVSHFNASEIFLGHGTDNPWDEAAALMAYSLNLPHFTDNSLLGLKLTATEKLQFAKLLQRRIAERVPVAYLTQQAWFARLPFYVDERVLVPRSPIAELILDGFQTWFPNNPPQRILDLCTGSGCIAIACAHYLPSAEVDAVDISEDALAVADLNIAEHDCYHQVFPILSDGFQALTGVQYDLIVTNPPYVDAEDMADLPAEFWHEPELGLASGKDGLALTMRILLEAAQHLTEQGVLICEVGNSMVALAERLPRVPFQWLEFKEGGIGVFALSKAQLVAHQQDIEEAVHGRE